MRIAFTSDVHTDHHAANRLVWQEMVTILQDLAPDVFVCCGDVAAEEKQFGMTLMALERVACPKLFVPGNHDVWVQKAAWVERGITSQQKYYQPLPALKVSPVSTPYGSHPMSWVMWPFAGALAGTTILCAMLISIHTSQSRIIAAKAFRIASGTTGDLSIGWPLRRLGARANA